MNPEQFDMRQAFQTSTKTFVRVTPKGFLLGEEVLEALQGRITGVSLLRKLFQDSMLVCDSTDGIRARNGMLCAECCHPRCQPRLRIQLAQGRVIYVLDLAITSAENLFSMEDEAKAEGQELLDWTLRLTVVNREYWGEVRFERIR